jgi:hypothetical protein
MSVHDRWENTDKASTLVADAGVKKVAVPA